MNGNYSVFIATRHLLCLCSRSSHFLSGRGGIFSILHNVRVNDNLSETSLRKDVKHELLTYGDGEVSFIFNGFAFHELFFLI